MRRFFIDRPVSAGMAHTINGPDARHITHVLRMKQGDEIAMFDGNGYTLKARIDMLSPKRVAVTITDVRPCETESPIHITIGQALLKDKKMDGLIRQLTELGMNEWLPFTAERSIPDPGRMRVHTRIERWQTIARESLKQCERGVLPQIHGPVAFDDVLSSIDNYDLGIIFTDKSAPGLEKIKPSISRVLILIGPEGGFTNDEIEQARSRGFVTAGMGPRILKADTAAVAASTLVQHLFGDM
ncbi:MAG: 16S rRNA (uracil(1498)-N(3))-methyltransferase [Thermodesulfobacteriota bacterium]|nr:16S rRNA (uracil(1498)-N(3))-methyltransferase [Thermodesulfobacteriota bacterium]